MKVDVVVVAHQSAAYLPRCLSELDRAYEVTVVDNASSDGSASAAENLGARVARNEENLGFARAANQGARTGRHELILFLNPDAHVAPDGVQALASCFEVDGNVGIAGPRLCTPSGKEQRAWWGFPHPSHTWAEALGLHRLARSHASGRDVPFVVGACFMVRRQLFEALGGFDERFWLYGEEADLCQRAWLRGWQVRYIPQVCAIHEGGASGQSSATDVFEHFQRGTELFIAKHQGAPALFSHRCGLLVGSLLRLPWLGWRHRVARDPRFGYRLAVVRRLLRVLTSQPLAVTPAPPPQASEGSR